VKPLGAWTREVFLLGAWAVLFKTLYVATAANSRLTADFLNLSGIWKISSDQSRDRVIRLFCVIYPMAALLIYLGIGEPKGLVKLGGTAQALMLPLISGGILYLRQRDRDARVAGTFFSDLLVWGAFFAITAVAVYSMPTLFHDWFGPIPWPAWTGLR
jgi:manganese transport protein